ncbi:enoyl-CoA hydratase/isomerase family protein [Nocardioides sp. AE5]|uniref:enoyl-CoA hydratase/isomerase family protein n=1 Tax=Nocardioides sp. AE5 TaxID=2962573 RepID=UPI00288151ED|nr:enoyl-CoA hydratase/isomerase family protein [Nocardioides sp. AE5]MDT0203931.1 enoyl-CoA hydratase/isomerase family protein [Nocardioides sp. AE5]
MPDFTIDTEVSDDHVGAVFFARGRNNFFSAEMIGAIAAALDELAASGRARAVVLSGVGKHFCAGADLVDGVSGAALTGPDELHLYDAATRLFESPLPIVAAVQGGAIGGGLGLALACDFRVASAASRFSAPFARLGVHPGFGLSVTLPLVVGHQRSLDLLYTGRRIGGKEAFDMGLADRLAPVGGELTAAKELAAQIAANAPLAVRSIKATLRGHLGEAVGVATSRERAEQDQHFQTEDAREGVRADAERRPPHFMGR